MCILPPGAKGRERNGTGVMGTACREGAEVVRAFATGAAGEIAAAATARHTAAAATKERVLFVLKDVLPIEDRMLESEETKLNIRIAIKTSE